MFIKSSDKPALLWQEKSVSYNELLRHINYYSTVYDSSSTAKIAIYSGNRFEWVYAFYSAWKNAAIVVPIDYLAQPDEIAYILNDCKPEVIFCSRDSAGNMKEILPLLNYQIKVIGGNTQETVMHLVIIAVIEVLSQLKRVPVS